MSLNQTSFYKIKITDDNGELLYYSKERALEFAKNLQDANKGYSDSWPKKWSKVDLELNNFDVSLSIIEWAGFEFKILKDQDEYFIDLAREEYGSSVRDNSRDELIELGIKLEEEGSIDL